MGEHDIAADTDDSVEREYARALFEDVYALERMLEGGLIETGVRRIGAELELFLVDEDLRPARSALEVLEGLEGPFTTELGLFNLEANLTPRVLEGPCFRDLEAELEELVGRVRAAAAAASTRVVLCGILPTLEREHLGLDYMTPIDRYRQLNRRMRQMRGGLFRTHIKGLDELQIVHDNVMLEACNTSFQVHFQVDPAAFARVYNLLQVVMAPVLAASVNSPMIFQRRLWHETRVALLQQTLDTRSEQAARHAARQRVSFGDRWVEESVLEIFRSDITRFRSLIAMPARESPLAVLDRGEIPRLNALALHNGTVYRWNRPCYGVTGGRPHLRIETRALPAGPTVVDQVANAAFLYGALRALDAEIADVRAQIDFDTARMNFTAAARYGLGARLEWLGGHRYGADELILKNLLPAARRGLARAGLDAGDAERYLSIVEARVSTRRTGAQWMLDSIASRALAGGRAERCRQVTAALIDRQAQGEPVHSWQLDEGPDHGVEREAMRTVGQVMSTDLFTVRSTDIVDLAANLMHWEHIRHVPVEDDQGRLVGLLTHRAVLRLVARRLAGEGELVTVGDVMRTAPVTVTPETSCLDAIERMRAERIGCLPVVRDGRLVGIVTERDFVRLSAGILDRWLAGG